MHKTLSVNLDCALGNLVEMMFTCNANRTNGCMLFSLAGVWSGSYSQCQAETYIGQEVLFPDTCDGRMSARCRDSTCCPRQPAGLQAHHQGDQVELLKGYPESCVLLKDIWSFKNSRQCLKSKTSLNVQKHLNLNILSFLFINGSYMTVLFGLIIKIFSLSVDSI